jgi:hypothetical protein
MRDLCMLMWLLSGSNLLQYILRRTGSLMTMMLTHCDRTSGPQGFSHSPDAAVNTVWHETLMVDEQRDREDKYV